MPGHVVKSAGPDPDPTEFLFLSLEQKRIDQSKPYDGKKACWVPEEKELYVQGEIKSMKGDIATVSMSNGEVNVQNCKPYK
jgi:myosin heavy chain 6/7